MDPSAKDEIIEKVCAGFFFGLVLEVGIFADGELCLLKLEVVLFYLFFDVLVGSILVLLGLILFDLEAGVGVAAALVYLIICSDIR